MHDELAYTWRGPASDEEMIELIESHGGRPETGWWDKTRPHSLGWVTARTSDGVLVGFVNIAWDGADHAFLLDTKTRGEWQRCGVGTELVRHAVRHAREAGCEWLHVDFEPHLRPFYFDACGFEPTEAGLIHLHSLGCSSGAGDTGRESDPFLGAHLQR
jgi:GNAT superfamily N-acetyltransferase